MKKIVLCGYDFCKSEGLWEKNTTVGEVGYLRQRRVWGKKLGPTSQDDATRGKTISPAPQAPGRKVRCGEPILLGPSRIQSPETQFLYGVALSLAQLRMLRGQGGGRRGGEQSWGVENAYFNAVLFVEDTSRSA